ncbi:autotransporter outer membrane beta-barrel domain-containing protein [Pelistega europaea]|uniref:Autotransporter outer membrane beta-barrel domain-containing protein n=1 Tax=Pelistega europaea TaxID=106147 RepID=A0A7Y4L9V7_9BURK|nr:autotransporter outer membrane beta-barrel domain-containing protein [Pelistega europaea]NOL49675.1 autotransporter outer membrane beta-barrel domain-containing protein [Pelistega europaea]
MGKQHFQLKATALAILTSLSCSAYADHPVYNTQDLYVQDRDIPYALVKDYLTVTSLAEITDPSDEYSGLFVGVHNRTGNPVRINWYGDMDGLTAQKGAINNGRIYGRLFINAIKSGNTYNTLEGVELKDYRSSIAPDGQANGIDAYGWVPVSNENDMTFALDKIENTGVVSGFAQLQTGAGTHRSLVVVNASANGVSLYGSGDYGKYIIGADGSEVAVDAATGGSRSARSVRSANEASVTGVDGVGVIPASLTSDDKNFYGKNIRVALDKLENSGLIQGKVVAQGSKVLDIDHDEAQDYAMISWASGNGVSLRTNLITQDRRTYSYEKINEAKLGNVNNNVGGRIVGDALLRSVDVKNDGSTNYTRSYDTGNGISVAARTLRFAKDQTFAEIGNVNNQGNIKGQLVQISGDNQSRALHNYSQSQAYNAGNGIGLSLEATQNVLGPVDEYGFRDEPGVRLSMGNIDNKGRIDGFADLMAGSGYGVINVEAMGVGNGISVSLKAGAAQDYSMKVGNINNDGVISGYLKAQAGMGGGGKEDAVLANKNLPLKEVELIITDDSNWNQNYRVNQAPPAPEEAVSCIRYASIKHSNCIQINAISDIKGSGNGVSIYTGRASDELTLGDVNNRGVMSGYSEIYHGFSDGEYRRVDFLGTGVGLFVDQPVSSSINNQGIISGTHAALLAKGSINDAYNVSEPSYQSAFTGTINNYGLMAGQLIAGNYNGGRTDADAKHQTYLYFNADKDPVNNMGTYVYLGKRAVMSQRVESANTASARNDFMNPESSTKLSELAEDMKSLNEHYKRNDGKILSTYRDFAVSDIKKVEKAYGSVSNTLTDDQRIDLYFKLNEALTDTKTADTFKLSYEDEWLPKAKWRDESNRTEILAQKNKLINQQQALAGLIQSLNGDSGFKVIYNQYLAFYNEQIKQLNEKLIKLNNHLKDVYHVDMPVVASEDGVVELPNTSSSTDALASAPYGVVDRIESAENSTQTIGGVEYKIINAPISGRDSSYTAVDNTIDHTIINGVGVANGALVANKDLTLTNSIVNGFVTALNIQGNTTVRLENTILNANGFAVKVLKDDGSVETRKSHAVLGDDANNVLYIGQNSIINGDIDLRAGNDKVVIGDESVRINVTDHTLDLGEGEDELVLGENVTAPTAAPLVVDYTVAGVERLLVNQPSRIMANRMELPSYMELHNKLVYQAPNNDAISLHNDDREQPVVSLAGKTLKVGIRSPEAYGALVVENANLNVSEAKLVIDSSLLDKATAEKEAWVINDIVSVKSTIYQCGDDAFVGQNCDGYDRNDGIADSYALQGKFASIEDNSALFTFEEYHAGKDKDGNSLEEGNGNNLKSLNMRVKRAVSVEEAVNSDEGSNSTSANPVSNEANPTPNVSSPSNESIAVAHLVDDVIDRALVGDNSAVELAKDFGKLPSLTLVRTAATQIAPVLYANTGNMLIEASRLIADNIPTGFVALDEKDSHRDTHVWGRYIGAWGKTKADSGNHGYLGLSSYKTHHNGFVLGATKYFDKGHIGASVAYLSSKARTTEAVLDEKLTSNTWQAGLYGEWLFTPKMALEGQLGYGHSSLKGTRYQSVLGVSNEGKYHADIAYASLGLRYYMGDDKYRVSPFVRANYHLVKMHSFSEKGGSTRLDVRKQNFDSLLLQAGVDGDFRLGDRWKLGGTLAVGVETLDKKPKLKAGFTVLPGETMPVYGIERPSVIGTAGVRAEFAPTNNSAVTLRYNTHFGKRYIDQQVQLNLRVVF